MSRETGLEGSASSRESPQGEASEPREGRRPSRERGRGGPTPQKQMPADSWSRPGAFCRLSRERCGKSYSNTCQIFHLKMVAGLSHGKAWNLLQEVPKAPYWLPPRRPGRGAGTGFSKRTQGSLTARTELFSCFFRILFYSCLVCSLG